MKNLISKEQSVELTATTLRTVIAQINLDLDAQQAVFMYSPYEGMVIPFAIVPINLEYEPTIVTIESLGLTPKEILQYVY